jgi:hypothetical protein
MMEMQRQERLQDQPGASQGREIPIVMATQ